MRARSTENLPEQPSMLPHEVVDDAPISEPAAAKQTADPLLRVGPVILAIVTGLVALFLARLGTVAAIASSAYGGQSAGAAALVFVCVAPPLVVSLVYSLRAPGAGPKHLQGTLMALLFSAVLAAVSFGLTLGMGIPIGRLIQSGLWSIARGAGAGAAGGLLGDALRRRETSTGTRAYLECALAVAAGAAFGLLATVGVPAAFGSGRAGLWLAGGLSGLAAGTATRGSRLTTLAVALSCAAVCAAPWGLVPIATGEIELNARLGAAVLCAVAGVGTSLLIRRTAAGPRARPREADA